MSENKSWSSIGEEIRDAVQKALQDGDFSGLGNAAANTVTDTVRNVSSIVGQAVSRENYTERMANATRDRKWRQAERERMEREAAAIRKSSAPFTAVGMVSGILFKIFGGIGTGVTALLSAVFLGLGIVFPGFTSLKVTFGIMLCLLGGSVAMLRSGIHRSARLKRARRYVELAGRNNYINIEDLALHTGRTKKAVLKDVKKMLEKGFFPQGHLDAQESCLMLDNKIYDEYLSLEKQRRIQEQERERMKQSKPEPAAQPETAGELDTMIAKGQDCIRRLRDMNDNIAGEDISAKLFRLENLLKEIFDRLKEHPEQLPKMQKFMDYYLPTTLKLVKAYEQFDSMSIQGQDILEAKVEIEKTLDTINSAFGELLNKMFRETALDVTTDAQVLQTMLAKEGLTREKEFEKIPR